jgi:hypothetical protein
MGSINLANDKGRNAVVGAQAVHKPLRVRWLDAQGRQAQSARIVKGDISRDANALAAKVGGMDKVAQALIDADPELDLEMYGSLLRDTSRVYIDPDGKIVNRVQQIEVVRNPDGTERERRPRKVQTANIVDETPIKWSGKLMKKSEAYNRFVFSGKRQIAHVNGLTYDFLFAMAKDLQEAQSFMLVGAGPKGNMPLILSKGGQPYRGFLEGRVQGDTYCLVLHLSNMELKAAPKQAEPAQEVGQ